MKAVVYHFRGDSWLRRWAEDFPELGCNLVTGLAELECEIADAEILLLTNRSASPELGELLRSKANALKWIHFLTAGFDRGVAMGLPDTALVSYAAGVKAPLVAEHALALLLALVRGLPQIAEAQTAHQWLREEVSAGISTLAEKAVCIIGLGHVGREVTDKLKAFRARVIAVSRRGKPGGNIDAVYPRERMGEALALADAIVICTGADASTKHMIDAKALSMVKRGAFLVNVARGSLVDEAALIDALARGTLSGAALDVQETEPLPAQNPLWDLPNLIVSPHSAGAGANAYAQHTDLFRKNLKRFLEGAPLKNQYCETSRR